jgi:hypothetical protein
MIPILLALAIIAILLFVVVHGQPCEFKLTRCTKIFATPGKVFPHVNDLHKWDAWSPWAKLDPNAKNSFTGPDSGIGAAMAWEGNKQVGVGKMTIVESHAGELVRFRLDFIKPFPQTNTAEFTFRSEAGQTHVVWTMTGRSNFFFKIFGLFVSCDDMAGKCFDKGLASLKELAERNG